jgi:hypothetical protein
MCFAGGGQSGGSPVNMGIGSQSGAGGSVAPAFNPTPTPPPVAAPAPAVVPVNPQQEPVKTAAPGSSMLTPAAPSKLAGNIEAQTPEAVLKKPYATYNFAGDNINPRLDVPKRKRDQTLVDNE